jgi:UrcA family protein
MNSSIKAAKRMRLRVSGLTLLACMCAASAAFAGEQGRSETVKFPDLNVSTPEGVQALYNRIHAASWHVCSTTSNDPLYQSAARDCAKKAEAKAIGTVNLPQLTAFYRMKTGDHTQPLSANR